MQSGLDNSVSKIYHKTLCGIDEVGCVSGADVIVQADVVRHIPSSVPSEMLSCRQNPSLDTEV